MKTTPLLILALLGATSLAPAATLLGSYGGRDWYVNTDALSLADARAAASAGGTLAAIRNAGDQAFLQSFLGGALDSGLTYTIGGSDEITEGTFLWDDGSAFAYTYWGTASEPNNYNNEDAIEWKPTSPEAGTTCPSMACGSPSTQSRPFPVLGRSSPSASARWGCSVGGKPRRRPWDRPLSPPPAPSLGRG